VDRIIIEVLQRGETILYPVHALDNDSTTGRKTRRLHKIDNRPDISEKSSSSRLQVIEALAYREFKGKS